MITQVDMYRRNIHQIQLDIADACARSKRSPDEVRLIGVTKYVDETAVEPLLEAGLVHFGENRWQQAEPKLATSRAQDAVWHFIGHLQKNKVKFVVPHFSWIHSVDSPELATQISEMAQKQNKVINCLIQVNVSGEESKSGIDPDALTEMIESVRHLRGISVRGLMTMAPAVVDIEQMRSIFRQLKSLQLEIQQRFEMDSFIELSMGMSNDFLVAIEEGATMVRVGRRLLFGPEAE